MVEMLTISAHVHSHTSTPTRAKSIQSYTPTLIPPGVPDARAACDMHVPAHPSSSRAATQDTRSLRLLLGQVGPAGWTRQCRPRGIASPHRTRLGVDSVAGRRHARELDASSMPPRAPTMAREFSASEGRGMDASRGALIEPELVVRIRRPGARWRARAVIFVVARWREGGQVAWIASYARRLLA